jgi:hypothetical protein
LVLTLGSPPKKGGKKNKKNPSINPGQRHLKYTEAGSAIECKARTVMSQTDRQTNAITIIDVFNNFIALINTTCESINLHWITYLNIGIDHMACEFASTTCGQHL